MERLTGKKLLTSRKAVGLSQFRLAKILGVSNSYLSEVERYDAEISEDLTVAIDEVLRTWSKPKKNRITEGNRRVSAPKSSGINTNCCEPPSIEDSNGLRAFAFFAGCGGLALGFSQAGVIVNGFVELDTAARASFKRNFPNAHCLAHDVQEVDPYLISTKDFPAILIGGPPCQGFSLAGKRDPNDTRNTLFRELLRCAAVWKPKVVVMENVRLLLSMKSAKGTLVIDDVVQEFEDLDYTVSLWTLNAADYGVPQSRERIFIVGVKNGKDIDAPSPTHAWSFRDDRLLPPATFRTATKGLKELESGESDPRDTLHWAVCHPNHVVDWLKDVPEGLSAHDNDEPSQRPTSGYNTTYKRLRFDEPSSTVGTTFAMISGSRNVHPKNTRSLTIREAARLQTFPDDYNFEGSWGEIRTQIGNAVPPMLGFVVANQILSEAFGDIHELK